MIKVICDRCKKDMNDDIWKIKALWTGLTMYYDKPEEFEFMGEFCEDCKKKIKEFSEHE